MTVLKLDFGNTDDFEGAEGAVPAACPALPPWPYTNKSDAVKEMATWLNWHLCALDNAATASAIDPDLAATMQQDRANEEFKRHLPGMLALSEACIAAKGGDLAPALKLFDAGEITKAMRDQLAARPPANRMAMPKSERRKKNWRFWEAARDVSRIVDLWRNEYGDVPKNLRGKEEACFFAARRWFRSCDENELRVIHRKLHMATNKSPNDYRRLDTE